jgi:hypothetical protein
MTLCVLFGFLWGAIYVTSHITGRDFHARMIARIGTMLPGAQPYGTYKAWDTRIPGILQDLKIWARNPIMGEGLGVHSAVFDTMPEWEARSLGHNSWLAALTQTGVPGFIAYLVTMALCFVIGRRMVRERTDRGSVLIGALGAVTAVVFSVLGVETGAFTNLRGGLLLGLVCGMVLRSRALQLGSAHWPAAASEQPYLSEYPYESDGYPAAGGAAYPQ